MLSASSEERLEYSAEELLSDGEYAEPLFANGVRCHGGFESDGSYRSPRLLHRAPAIRAWQARLAHQGGELVEISRTLMPPQYPNLDQAVLLVREGVRDPIVRALTIISIVEGFGAIVRDIKVPDLDALVVEPIVGTGLAHLRSGLLEAHARDEAGYRDQGGHKQMWEAARDLAFDNPRIPPDVLMRLMGRRVRQRGRDRLFPEIDESLERMLATFVQVLVVEVFAEGTFEWGKALLSHPEVSVDPQSASQMVGYIQSDEKPHVEYLRTVLSELRVRNVRTLTGELLSGQKLVDGMLQRTLGEISNRRRSEQREDTRSNLADAVKVAQKPSRVMEQFDALETPWVPPVRTGFESAAMDGSSA